MIDETALCTKQTARILGLSPRTLEQQRLRGRGLPYIKIGRQIRYLLSDVLAYLRDNRHDPSGAGALAA
jgi:hypothetical protein